jgi:hypothetical protein
MSLLRFGTRPFEADAVIFDKDGTLIDFDTMWGHWAKLSVSRLAAEAGDGELEGELYALLGYDPEARQTRPESPLSIAGTSQLAIIAAAVLCRHGIPWTDAEERARRAFLERDDLPLASLVQPARRPRRRCRFWESAAWLIIWSPVTTPCPPSPPPMPCSSPAASSGSTLPARPSWGILWLTC